MIPLRSFFTEFSFIPYKIDAAFEKITLRSTASVRRDIFYLINTLMTGDFVQKIIFDLLTRQRDFFWIFLP